MTPPLVSRRAAAALFLERQMLDRPRGRRLGAAPLRAFVASACGLQIDSVNVVDRAHHLTLWNRFGEFDRRLLERLLYRQRVLFEYLCHVACFVCTDDLPIWRGFMAAEPARLRQRWEGEVDRWPIDDVERAIAERGPLGTADFAPPPGHPGAGWWSWKPTTHALDYLWKSGRIAVHSRQHFHKRFGLTASVLPGAAQAAPLPPPELRRQRVLRSLAAMGAASLDDLQQYWSWPTQTRRDIAATLAELAREQRVSEVRVEGQPGGWFARREDLAALERAGRRRQPSNGTALLCPFDSFLWHRARTERLFGFRYRIEIYTPGHRRTHGYYTLPILHQGQLIGRVDPKADRERGLLEVKHVHFEPWFARGQPPPAASWGPVDVEGALAAVAEALGSLARFAVGADRVTLGRVTPPRLRGALARALRG